MKNGASWSIARLIVIVLSIITTSFPALASAQDVASRAFPSVVLLIMRDANRQPLSLGSGFFVNANTVATNAHVIEGAASGTVRIVGRETKYAIEGTVGVDERRDIVLLRIRDVVGTPIGLADSSTVCVGDQVYAIGNPLGLEGTMSQGIVSGIRTIGEDRLIQMTAPVSPGSSGGPVLNAQGGVVGVAVGTFTSGQNLNFAIPSDYVKELHQNRTPVQPLRAQAATSSEQSVLDDLGRPAAEGVAGEKMSWGIFGRFSFSIRNRLPNAVKDVWCLVIFHDSEGDPVDFKLVECKDVILPGLAKRVQSRVDSEVWEFIQGKNNYEQEPKARVVFRVLDFSVVQ